MPKQRILVVDDDALVARTISMTLERKGFAVTIADGGLTGLAALGTEIFDAMIVDVFIPHMRAFDSIRVFHERAPAVPLIAISGYAFGQDDTPAPDLLTMAIKLGATRCLRKPFTPAALWTAVDESMTDAKLHSVFVIERQSSSTTPGMNPDHH
jgi:CheY-like chemotaxis protein